MNRFRQHINGPALRFALLLTSVLFVTGLASVPWASQWPPMVENALYALGRLPVVYVVYLIFQWGKNEAPGS